jgi:hypothetical protein
MRVMSQYSYVKDFALTISHLITRGLGMARTKATLGEVRLK